MTVDFERVELADVSRHFGRRRAVARVSMSVAAGEILGLLGPNGAGKSTLIAMLATLVQPSVGAIRYGGRSPAECGPGLRKQVGLLAHELQLYPELTARQNLDFFARLYGLDPQLVVPAALESASLADRADDAVSGFSRGMRQRLALERSLQHQPRLLLLDEPFTGLDDRSVTIVVGRLKALAAGGTIVVLATHDLDLAEGLLDHAVFLRDGRVVKSLARPEELRATYRALMTGSRT